MSQHRRGMRWQSVMLMTALALLLAGCALPSLPSLPWSQHGAATLPDAQQVLRVSALDTSYLNEWLDPIHQIPESGGAAQIAPLLYSGLFTLDANRRLVSALVDHYAVSVNGLRYTFHLRPNARFSDGTIITSADAAFSLDRVAGPCGSYASFAFTALHDQPRFTAQNCLFHQHAPPTITASANGQPVILTLVGDALLTPDPSTLVVVLARPDGALLAKLAEPFSLIVERSVVLRYGGDWIHHLADGGGQGTSGMYAKPRSASDGDNGQTLTLERAATYWGAKPRLREIIINLRSQQALATGDVVFAKEGSGGSQQASPGQTLGKQSGFHAAPARAAEYLILNPTEPGLGDVRLRQALALALDKPTLAALINGQATNHLISPGTGAYPTTLSGPIANAPLTGDGAQARVLWQSYIQGRCGGDASHCPSIKLWVYGEDMSGVDPTQQAFAQALTRQWQAALPGLRVTIATYIITLLTNASAPHIYTSIYEWIEDYPDPQDWLGPFTTTSGANFPLYVHEAQSDTLIARAEATLDPAARLALYHQAEMTLLNDALVIPIAQPQVIWSVKPTVVNFPADPAPWIPPSAWARIYLTSATGK